MTLDEKPYLKRSLDMDTGDDGDDTEALIPLMMSLADSTIPAPSAQATDDLIRLLSAEMPSAKANTVSTPNIRWIGLVLWSQLRVVQKEIWLASLLVMVLGTIVSLLRYDPASGNLTALAIIAPVIAAVGIGLLYDDDMALIRELEDSTLMSTSMLMLARLLLVFCFNLVLATTGSIVLALAETQLSLIPVIMSWLAPMTFLSALAFFISVLSAQAIAGGLISLVLWALHILMQVADKQSIAIQILSLQGLSALVTRPFLFIVAGLLVAVTLWYLQQQEHHHGASNQ
ncbi:MAG: hypothetical protein RLP44_11075 [Aggregatilineales bacterium]